MTWQFIVKHLLLPPGGLILIFLLCWLLRRLLPRISALLFWPTLLFFVALCLPLTTAWLASQLEQEPALSSHKWPSLNQHAQAIVVLGGGREMADQAWEEDQPSLLSQQRLRYASRIAKVSGLPVLVSGGLHHGQPPSEAQIAAQTLSTDFGVNAKWREDFSRTTWENARFSADILQAEDITHIVLVTDAWHMPRARWSFEQYGFTVISAPQGFWQTRPSNLAASLLPDSRAFWHNSLLLHEWLGMRWYKNNHRAPALSQH